MSGTEKSPLARLVLFMVLLSVTGTIIAGGHYFAIDLPAQKNVHAPTNSDTCASTCGMQKMDCARNCPKDSNQGSCLDACMEIYYDCTCRYCKLYC